MSAGVNDVPYFVPRRRGKGTARKVYVDRELSFTVLDRLNRLPKVRVYVVCAGHPDGPGDRHAHLIVKTRHFADLEVYCRRLSVGDYTATVEYYRGNGQPGAWHLEIKRAEEGCAPASWWHGLVDELEDNPDCDQWMS